MNSSVEEKNHQHFQDLVGGAALGILTADEHAELMAHLETCTACQLDLAEFSSVVELIPLSLDDASPSPALRNRVQMMIQSELSSETSNIGHIPVTPVQEIATPVERAERSRPQQRRELPDPNEAHDFVPIPIGTKSHRRRLSPFLWGIAALALVAIISGAVIGRYFLVDNNSNDEQGQQIALDFSGAVKSDTATLTFFPKTDLLVFSASDLPPAPEGHVYQVWMIAGNTPQPMGTIGPNGYATVANINNFDAFAVTVEPGPLGSSAPTTKPFIVAPLKPASS